MKKYKFLSLLEIFILSCFMFSTNVFVKQVKCNNIECKVLNDKDGIVNIENFQEIFEPLKGKKMSSIDLVNFRNEIKKIKVVDDIKILKKKDSVRVELKPHKILGIAYYNHLEEGEKKSPEFILDNGEKVFLQLKKEKNFIPVIFDDENMKIGDILPVLSFINSNPKVKSMVNTISLKNGNFYVTTILNDCFVNLGSFLDTKSIIYRICDMHKIIYFSNNFPCIELSDKALFLQKKKI